MSGTSADFVRYYENLGQVRNELGGARGAERLQAVVGALQAAGVEFIDNGQGPGVTLTKTNQS